MMTTIVVAAEVQEVTPEEETSKETIRVDLLQMAVAGPGAVADQAHNPAGVQAVDRALEAEEETVEEIMEVLQAEEDLLQIPIQEDRVQEIPTPEDLVTVLAVQADQIQEIIQEEEVQDQEEVPIQAEILQKEVSLP